MSAGGGFTSADVGTAGSTRDFSGGAVGSVDNVATPQVPRHTGRYGKRQKSMVSG